MKVEETKVTRKLYSELMEQTELAILEGKLTGYMTRDEARQFGATQRAQTKVLKAMARDAVHAAYHGDFSKVKAMMDMVRR